MHASLRQHLIMYQGVGWRYGRRGRVACSPSLALQVASISGKASMPQALSICSTASSSLPFAGCLESANYRVRVNLYESLISSCGEDNVALLDFVLHAEPFKKE